jgi:hypothetical protein
VVYVPNELMTRQQIVEELSKPLLRALITDILRNPPARGADVVIKALWGTAVLTAPTGLRDYKSWLNEFYNALDALGGPTPGLTVPPRPKAARKRPTRTRRPGGS